MENLEKILDKRLEIDNLEDLDPRLSSDTRMSKASSRLQRMEPLPDQPVAVQQVNTNLQRDKVRLSDGIIREEEEIDVSIKDPDQSKEAENYGGSTPGGSGYTLENAKNQLDGIVDKWMELAGYYPDGEKRHDFLEIGERLREISGVLQRDFLGIREAIEGLPSSSDPYSSPDRWGKGEDLPSAGDPPPSQDPTEADDEELGMDDELDDELDDDLGDLEDDLGGLEDDLGGLGDEETGPEIPSWSSLELPNKKDIGFERSDGFKLRFRPVNMVPGRYMAQLWRDDKILDKGRLDVPEGEDAASFIQKMADYMLDGNSNRYKQQEPIEEPAQDYGTQPEDEIEDTDIDVDDEFPDDEEIEDAAGSEVEDMDVSDIALDLGEGIYHSDDSFRPISEECVHNVISKRRKGRSLSLWDRCGSR